MTPLQEAIEMSEMIEEMKSFGFDFSWSDVDGQHIMYKGNVVCSCTTLREVAAFYIGFKMNKGDK